MTGGNATAHATNPQHRLSHALQREEGEKESGPECAGQDDPAPIGEVGIAPFGQTSRRASAAEERGCQGSRKRAFRSLDLEAISMDDWC